MGRLSTSPFRVLFLPCRPSAIGWFVAAAIVDPIKRLSLRTFSHIVIEGLKIVPSLTYRHSAASVVLVLTMLPVLASSKHGTPRDVFRGVRHAMSRGAIADGFTVKTSTRLSSSTSHVGFSCYYGRAALTGKLPEVPSVSDFLEANSEQSEKRFPLNWIRHCEASAADRVTAAQVRPSDLHGVAALTQAHPVGIAVDIALGPTEDSKNAEFHAAHVFDHIGIVSQWARQVRYRRLSTMMERG
jgi:hypothetical protein